MVAAASLFLTLAIIILIGFFSGLLAWRGHFPDLLVLIGLGLLLGPVNTHVLHIEGLARAVGEIPFDLVTSIFGALALSVIMFDAGLTLSLSDIASGMRSALVHTTAIFVASVALVAAACHLLLGFPWLVAALFGTIVGGISSAVAVSVIRGIRVSAKARALVTVECIIVDVLTIGTAIALLETIRSGGLDGASVLRAVVQTLAVGVTVGVAVGLVFVFSLPRMRGVPNLYILTLGAFLGSYALIEALGGSGPMGVLAFGLVLGNSRHPVFGRRDLAPELTEEIGRFHSQTTFLVRTFFFVLIGLTFAFELPAGAGEAIRPAAAFLSPLAGTTLLLWIGGFACYALIVGARTLVCAWTAPEPADRLPLSLIVGRGLGSAVLATFPFTVEAMSDPTSSYARTMAPYAGVLPTLAGIVIILSVLTTAIGIFVTEWRRSGRTPASPQRVISRTRP